MTGEKGVFELLTPPGEGGIAVFGLEGAAVRDVLSTTIASPRLSGLRPGELAYGRMTDEDGALLDEVIIACLQPHSENIERFELNCHAGGAAATAAAARLGALGLRRGKLPRAPRLTELQAEFRSAFGSARTKRQAQALAAAHNAVSPELERAASLLVSNGGAAEAAAILTEIVDESTRLARLMKTHRVALIGPTNAGKSTLLNRLAGADRAITSPHPGTTRDTVEASVSINGVSLDLVDTAGIGAAPGLELARRSEEMSVASAREADLCILVLDGSADTAQEDIEHLRAAASGSTITVRNKADLITSAVRGEGVAISARTGEGVARFLTLMEERLLPDPPRGGAAVPSPQAITTAQQAYTCARRASVENVHEAAGILAALGGTPV